MPPEERSDIENDDDIRRIQVQVEMQNGQGTTAAREYDKKQLEFLESMQRRWQEEVAIMKGSTHYGEFVQHELRTRQGELGSSSQYTGAARTANESRLEREISLLQSQLNHIQNTTQTTRNEPGGPVSISQNSANRASEEQKQISQPEPSEESKKS